MTFCLSKFSSGGSLTWGTYFGGPHEEGYYNLSIQLSSRNRNWMEMEIFIFQEEPDPHQDWPVERSIKQHIMVLSMMQ